MHADTLGLLLRSPAAIARRCREEQDLGSLCLVALAVIALGSAVFGATIGSHRGGVQIAAAAAKLPLAVLLALALAVPAFHALAHAHERAWSFRTTVAITLASMARASLVLLAVSPLLWVAVDGGLGYHASAVIAAGLYLLAGLAAIGVLVRGLGAGPGRAGAVVSLVLVFFAVGGQTAWILRPYLVRPQTTVVPFVRTTEGSFADAVLTSARSAAGIYRQPRVHKPGWRDGRSPWAEHDDAAL